MMLDSSYAQESDKENEPEKLAGHAERALIGLILAAASLCVVLIAVYVVLLDGMPL